MLLYTYIFKIEHFASLHRRSRLEIAINASLNAPSPELTAGLTAPSAAYKNSARLAVAGLLMFVAMHVGLAGWFLYTPSQVFFEGAGSNPGFFACLMAACGKDPRAAGRRLDGVDPEESAHAWSAALVLLGRKAPAKWRTSVKRLLFLSERLYFKAV